MGGLLLAVVIDAHVWRENGREIIKRIASRKDPRPFLLGSPVPFNCLRTAVRGLVMSLVVRSYPHQVILRLNQVLSRSSSLGSRTTFLLLVVLVLFLRILKKFAFLCRNLSKSRSYHCACLM